jgi:hypothetical protein
LKKLKLVKLKLERSSYLVLIKKESEKKC